MLSDYEILTPAFLESNVTGGNSPAFDRCCRPILIAICAVILGVLCGMSCGG